MRPNYEPYFNRTIRCEQKLNSPMGLTKQAQFSTKERRRKMLGLCHNPITRTAKKPSSISVRDPACFFLSFKANARVKTRKDGARPALFQIVGLFYVLFVLCRSVCCFCVNVYCTTATGWLPNCS